MMTQEEKAKAYDEALKRAKELYVPAKRENSPAWASYEYIFPQLAESEDEKIRKWIINFIEVRLPDAAEFEPEYRAALAWLEKQKEQKPNVEICPHSIKSKSYKENGYPIEDCDYGLEIAEDILEKTLGKVQGYQSDDGIREHQTAIEAVKDAMKEQKPIKWTDLTWKDIVELEGIINNVHYDFSAGIGQESFGKEVLERFRNKKDDAEVDACEPKQEWSEEDEIRRKETLGLLDEAEDYLLAKHLGFYEDLKLVRGWLESTKQKEQKPVDYDHEMWKNCEANYNKGVSEGRRMERAEMWKPSEEQMRIFRSAIDFAYGVHVFYQKDIPILESLYNDLIRQKEKEK